MSTLKTSLLASAALALTCGLASAQEVTGDITFITHFGNFLADGSFDRWTAEFEAKYPGTDVEVIALGDFRNEINTRMAAQDYGDAVNILDSLPASELPNFFLPLDQIDVPADFQFQDRYTYDGDFYGMIYGANAEAIVYNKAAFERAGVTEVPTTVSEFLAACESLRDAGITPLQINMGAGWPMQQWDKAALIFAEDGGYYDSMLTNAAPYAAGEPYGQSIGLVNTFFESGCTERDYTADGWNESKSQIAAGEIGMWFLANWSIPQAIAAGEGLGLENVSDDLGMFPLPIDESGQGRVLVTPDWAIGVSKYADNPVGAQAWIEFLLLETDMPEYAGFIPGDPAKQPTVPQLQELLAAEPELIEMGTPSSDFLSAMTEARIDFMTGTYIRDVLLAEDFDAAIDDLNARWARATGQ